MSEKPSRLKIKYNQSVYGGNGIGYTVDGVFYEPGSEGYAAKLRADAGVSLEDLKMIQESGAITSLGREQSASRTIKTADGKVASEKTTIKIDKNGESTKIVEVSDGKTTKIKTTKSDGSVIEREVSNTDGLPSGLPDTDGLPSGLPDTDGLPSGLPDTDGLPSGLPGNDVSSSETDAKSECKPKIPPIIIGNPQDGFIRVGIETSGKVTRKSQVQVSSGSKAALRLFKDGGWELKSNENKIGSEIIQKGEGPLIIKSEGNIDIDCDGTFSVTARDIVMKSTHPVEGDIVLNSAHNFRANVENYAIIMGTQVTLDAKQTLISHCEGMHYIVGNSVRIHEPVSKLIPPNFGKAINKLTKTLKQN